MGTWRPDLQGKQRPESVTLDRDVFVSTAYGQVQGFKVHLYDDPTPESGYRPDQTPLERIQGHVTVFLGIPYALPPINEARFKVRLYFYLKSFAVWIFNENCTVIELYLGK